MVETTVLNLMKGMKTLRPCKVKELVSDFTGGKGRNRISGSKHITSPLIIQ